MGTSDILRRHDARLTLVEESIWLIHRRLGVPAYDFDVEAHLECSRPNTPPDGGTAVVRMGPLADYDELYTALAEDGLILVNDPEQYARATDLTVWFQALEDLTPRSRWWAEPPTGAEVSDEFEWRAAMLVYRVCRCGGPFSI